MQETPDSLLRKHDIWEKVADNKNIIWKLSILCCFTISITILILTTAVFRGVKQPKHSWLPQIFVASPNIYGLMYKKGLFWKIIFSKLVNQRSHKCLGCLTPCRIQMSTYTYKLWTIFTIHIHKKQSINFSKTMMGDEEVVWHTISYVTPTEDNTRCWWAKAWHQNALQ